LRITSSLTLDAWGRTVFKRAVRGTWAIWAVLTLSHVWFWADEFDLRGALCVPLLLLLSTRWMPRESSVWLAVAGALLAGCMMPAFFVTIALMAAITLALRALRQPSDAPAEEFDAPAASERPHARPIRFGFAERPERMRLLTGSASSLYLAAWTPDWFGGALPPHSLWLDVLLTAVLLAMVWGLRAYVALVPLALDYVHLGYQSGALSLPRTRTEWGLSEVGLGFALLIAALLTSLRLRASQTQDYSTARAPEDDSGPAP
jgi:hypothetical protein